MPQMSPTMWTIILFFSTFMIFQIMTMNFFDSQFKSSKQTTMKKLKINWKW
uniref:ATP synthase F0 subunit 8 n=1 Tax=Lophops carinata TaxID=130616 RepID=A0A7M1ICB9_9HEMI|nr:ATP synthase F0 subunit 8 [Lophops carinata]QOQ36881.1 ATP synthase F0 subunit 8 [Lophops carinata]